MMYVELTQDTGKNTQKKSKDACDFVIKQYSDQNKIVEIQLCRIQLDKLNKLEVVNVQYLDVQIL